jgi:3D-(3,5/4)-trihydroxycyclohexane-1,2-dione acylhydrolase (decyclizing)
MFGIFGHGNVHGLGQALLQHRAVLPLFPARNEQAMVHMAAAYAKSERRLSTFACASSIGPGATNMVTGAALATVNRLPVLLLPADYFANRRQGPVLQQLEDPSSGDLSVNDSFRNVSRYFDRITRPEQLLTALPEACRILTSPTESGAVVLSLPQDVQSEAYDYPDHFFEPRIWHVHRAPPPREQVTDVLKLIEESERPVIIAGGGVRYSAAEDELLQFATRFAIPVTETFAGKGSMSGDSWLTLGGMGTSGNPAANQVLRDADLVICLGTRLTDTQTGSSSLFQCPTVRFVSINLDERDAAKLAALPVIGDIRQTLRELLASTDQQEIPPARSEYERSVRELTAEWTEALRTATEPGEDALHQGAIVRALNDFAEPGDIVIGASGTLPTDLLKYWDASAGKECYLEFGFSCMTHEVAAAIGVRLSRPTGQVYALFGDGSFLMNPTEIATAAQLGLKVTYIVVENHGYRSIHGLQLRRTGPGDLGNELRALNPETQQRDGDYLALDLARIAEGLGAATLRVATPPELGRALEDVRDKPGPHVIVAAAGPPYYSPDSLAWREVPPAEITADGSGAARRAEYDEERRRQRLYY